MSFEFSLFSNWTSYALLGLVFLLYKWSMSSFTYFEKTGVAFNKPWPIIGNFGPLLLKKETLQDMVTEAYNKFQNNR